MCRREKWSVLILLCLMVILTLSAWVKQGQAQDKYPTRAIDVIAPVSPGGGIDTSNRVAAAYISKKWGVPINIVNKPGGNFVNGTLDVYEAAPDGYTLLTDSPASSTELVKVVGGQQNLPFDVMKRTFMAMWGVNYMVFFVKADSPLNTLKDVEALVKKDPQKFIWAAHGGVTDYVFFQFLNSIGVDVLQTKPIQLAGTGRSLPMIAGGHVLIGAASLTGLISSIRGGLIKVLAIVAPVRDSQLPDVPTVKEAGYPKITGVQWFGYSGPPNVPSYIVEIWDKTVKEMMEDKEMVSRLKKVFVDPLYRNAREAREYAIEEMAEVDRVWKISK